MVVTKDDCYLRVEVFPPIISDHGLVTATIPFLHETPLYAVRQIRGWRRLDREKFTAAVLAVPAFQDPIQFQDEPADHLFDIFQREMTVIIDRLLPLRPSRMRTRPLSPWFDGECFTLRRQARRLERVFRRSGLAADRAAWVKFVRTMHRRHREKEGQYWESMIKSSSGDPRHLWSTFKDLLGSSGATSSPAPPPFSADEYANFYATKINAVRRDTADSPSPSFSSTELSLFPPLLRSLRLSCVASSSPRLPSRRNWIFFQLFSSRSKSKPSSRS